MTLMALCALAIILALTVGVGFASHTILHHLVQTLPLWVVVFVRRRPLAAWFALPCFAFWLFIMLLIWLFLLGIARVVSGHFSPVEIAMTLIVGIASLIGITRAVRTRTTVAPALLAIVAGAAAQYACFWISKIPVIWNH